MYLEEEKSREYWQYQNKRFSLDHTQAWTATGCLADLRTIQIVSAGGEEVREFVTHMQ